MIVKLSDIRIGKRKRARDISKVRALAESIKAVGLLNPVTLNSDNELISGLHRLEAYKLLGFETIEATKKDFAAIQRELAEIDENLIRKELSALELGEFLVTRDELLDAMGLRAKAGDNQHTLRGSAPKTTKQIANEIGIAERTLQLHKQIVNNLTEPTKVKIRNTEIANNGTALLEISKLPPEQQLKVADKLTGTEDKKRIKRRVCPDLPKGKWLIFKGLLTSIYQRISRGC
jgi:ParB family chromosome partitioning protein